MGRADSERRFSDDSGEESGGATPVELFSDPELEGLSLRETATIVATHGQSALSLVARHDERNKQVIAFETYLSER